MKKIFLTFLTFFAVTIFAQKAPIVLHVNYKQGNCKIKPYGTCFQIREGTEKKWKNYIGQIRGLDYEEGFVYDITVKRMMHELPPENGINYYYKVIKVLRKRPVSNSTIKLSNKKYYFWHYLDGRKFKDVVPLKGYIQFDVKNKNVSGEDGCNGFGGTIKSITAKKITLGPLMGTLMACPDLNNSDFKIKQLLEKVTGYKLNGIELELLQGNKTILKCSEASASITDVPER